jgi:thermostable 8-oxoguanine DNA glycosylase
MEREELTEKLKNSTEFVDELKDTIHDQFDKLQRIKKIVNNEKVSGIEAKLMIKDILEGRY